MFRLGRNYCVTVMDNWTPTRMFWTLKRARRWRGQHQASHLWEWRGYWHEIETDRAAAAMASLERGLKEATHG